MKVTLGNLDELLATPPPMHLPTARAKIVADSIGSHDIRLTTVEAEWPRYMHGDFMTHRALSRNGLSSRAEPVIRAIERAVFDPVEPLVWMYDEKRMQHGRVMTDEDAARSRLLWNKARKSALAIGLEFLDLGLHRQYLNRIIEPYLRIKMVVSATTWANFFALRAHPAPMPEIQQLAITIARLLKEHKPRRLLPGDWHLPYCTAEERTIYRGEAMAEISTARCARASYGKLGDGSPATHLEDHALFQRLMGDDPKHASPAEHPAMCVGDPGVRSGNFRGWIQFRHTILGESADDRMFDLDAKLVQYNGVDYIV